MEKFYRVRPLCVCVRCVKCDECRGELESVCVETPRPTWGVGGTDGYLGAGVDEGVPHSAWSTAGYFRGRGLSGLAAWNASTSSVA